MINQTWIENNRFEKVATLRDFEYQVHQDSLSRVEDVVYLYFDAEKDEVVYVGETSRKWLNRMKEMKRSFSQALSNKKTDNTNSSFSRGKRWVNSIDSKTELSIYVKKADSLEIYGQEVSLRESEESALRMKFNPRLNISS